MALENIESIYPLSPMQASMLFYAQSRITAKNAGIGDMQLTHDVLFNQTNIDITGNIELPAFQQAWQKVAVDNSAFRTGFLWEGLKQAQQFVRKEVELPFEFTSLADQSDQAQHQALQDIMEADSKLGFDLTTAPLMRVHLIQLGTERYRLMWSCHHLVIDRWCIPIVFESLTKYYDDLVQNQVLSLTKAPPYKRYIAWLHKQKMDKSEHYWRVNLGGFTHPSLLCKRDPSAPQMKFEHFIDAALMAQVSQVCKTHKITLANFFQSAWSLTLNKSLGLQDIIYGLVVSGRPAQITDVENIIGTFVNNLPVRQKLPQQANIVQWLKQNQSQSFQRIEHEHESIIKLHDYTQLQADEPIFDHVLVWQNPAALGKSEYFTMVPVQGNLTTAYPLTISIEEKDKGLQFLATVNAGWHFTHHNTFFTSLKSVVTQLVNLTKDKTLADIKGFTLSDTYVENEASSAETNNQLALTTSMPLADEKVMKGRTALNKGMVEEFLTREWKSILELEHIDLDEDFFALGGSSLKAAQLVARLEQAEKKNIPIIQLFAGRTIRTMAQVYLKSDWSVKPGWVIPVNTKGKGKPIFYIASPEVNVIGYAQLARELGKDINGFIVQPPPQSEHIRQVRTKDMPALSLEYIKEIRQIQKDGPYHIVGMCSGAHISGEIMRQMQKQSLEVGYFAIINTWSLYSISKLYHFEKVVDFYRMMRYYTRRIFSIKMSEIKNRFLPALINKVKPTPSIPEAHANANSEPSSISESLVIVRQYDETVVPVKEEKWASERPSDIAIIKYPMTVFRIESKPYWRINSKELGWNYLAEQIKVIQLRETVHEAILRDPHIAHFASQLREDFLSSKIR